MASPEERDAVGVVRKAYRAYQLARWERFAELVDPDAEFEMVAAGRRLVRGRERILETLRSSELETYTHLFGDFREIKPNVVLLTGSVRSLTGEADPAGSRFAWLAEVRAGLLWRVRVYASVREALAAAGQLDNSV